MKIAEHEKSYLNRRLTVGIDRELDEANDNFGRREPDGFPTALVTSRMLITAKQVIANDGELADLIDQLHDYVNH